MAGNIPVRPTRRVPEQALDGDEEDFILDVAEEDLSIINENDSISDETSSDGSLSSYDPALVEPPIPEEDNPYTMDDALRAPVDAAIGEPELEALLAEGGRDLSVDRIVKLFPFPLDGFQKKALEKLVEGKSVVVCAPTGAGKTAIAEAASAATLARGQRVIYTTPLKALSNQKLAEVKKRFGVDRCGLQTGDTSLNTEADIVVMTTEILRNIMYRTAEISEERTGGGAASSNTREARLGNVGLVVLDEVHYLGDPSRGSVWEEVIINCPRHIQLLCMSATVKNPDDLGGWISQEHQECVTIKTTFRPVPLMWHFAYRNAGGVQMADLLDRTGKKLNPRLEPREVMFEEARFLLGREQGPPSRDWGRDKGRKDRGMRGGSSSNQGPSWEKRLQMMLDEEGGSSMMQRKVNMIRIPPMDGVISKLKRQGFLPAIWFILSRKDCDLNAIKAGQGGSLTTAEEQALILKEVEALQ
jgi:superfamily II RNA helicase